MKKTHRIRLGAARSKTKQQEKAFLKKAGEIKEHPERLIPECDKKRSILCPFSRLQKQLKVIYNNRDNPEKIEKFTKKGDHIARAYASMIKIYSDGKIPMFAAAKTPWGEVKYVMRSHIARDKQVGVQNYDDPKIRLLAYADIIKKRGITIYSLKDKMICYCPSMKFNKPPKEFIDFALSRISAKLDKTLSCPHLDSEMIEKESEKRSYLEIHWKTAEKKIYLCKACAEQHGTNTFSEITQYIGSKVVKEHFDVNYHLNIKCLSLKGGCICRTFLKNLPELKEDYKKGKLTDLEYINKTENQIKKKILNSNEKLYIHGTRCFGSDMGSFLDSLKVDSMLRHALEISLNKRSKPVFLQDESPVHLLKEMWDDAGVDILKELCGDEAVARRLFEENNPDEVSPTRILRMAKDYKALEEIKKRLPVYESLPEKAEFADHIARSYKLYGKDTALREIKARMSESTRALAFAFYLSLNASEKVSWKFSEEEKNYGSFLKPFAESLLKVEGEEYHNSLQRILQAAGSTEKIEKKENDKSAGAGI